MGYNSKIGMLSTVFSLIRMRVILAPMVSAQPTVFIPYEGPNCVQGGLGTFYFNVPRIIDSEFGMIMSSLSTIYR